MTIRYHKQFQRQFKKLKANEHQKAIDRINAFIDNPYDRLLNNHSLKGNYLGFRSINISGDLRAIYKEVNQNEAIFVTIDSHSNLYR